MFTKSITPFWLTVLNRLAAADQRYRDAQKLKSLPSERLADMGMSRTDADRAFVRDQYNRPVDSIPLPLTSRS